MTKPKAWTILTTERPDSEQAENLQTFRNVSSSMWELTVEPHEVRPALAATGIWGLNQKMDSLCLFLSNSTNKIK